MSVVTVTPVTLAPNTRSADLVGTGDTVTTSDTFTIPVLGNTRTIILVAQELGSGAATITFNAGDNPPSFLTASSTLVLATSDLRVWKFEPGQFIQDDQSGSITGSVATNSVKLYALRESNAE
jgi:hypothetical protein